MFIATKITGSLITSEIYTVEGYEYSGELALACGPSDDEKQIAANSKKFSDTMFSQAEAILGADNEIFGTLKNEYAPIIAGGPSQMGFSEAERSARTTEAIETGAHEARAALTGAKSAISAIGGGNVPTTGGAARSAILEAATKAAADTAAAKRAVTAENWATGRQNFWNASQLYQGLPSVYNNVYGTEKAATEAGGVAMQNAQDIAAQKGWWKKPVMGLVNAGLGAVTGGLSNLATTAVSKIPGFGATPTSTT